MMFPGIRLLIAAPVALLLSIAAGACRSVGPISDLSAALEELPNLRFENLRNGAGASGQNEDFRLRESARDFTALALQPLRGSNDGDLSEAEQTVLMLRLEQALRKTGARLTVLPPAPNLAEEELKERLRRDQFDALLVPRIELAEGGRRGALLVAFQDAFNFEPLAELRVSFDRETPAAGGNRIDLAGSASGFELLDVRNQGGVRAAPIDMAALRGCVEAVTTGSLTALSTSGDTEVILERGGRKQSLGKAPQRNVSLKEGRASVIMRREGQEDQVFSVQIRAGKTSLIAANWPDEGGASDLAILSAPAGLRAAVDSELRGSTPLYLTDLQPGSYRIELSRAEENGPAIVQVEGAVQAGGGSAVRVFFVNYRQDFQSAIGEGDYWQSASQDGAPEIVSAGGLGFRGASARSSAWLGLASQPAILEEEFDLEFNLAESEGGQLLVGLYSNEGASALVQMRGTNFTVQRFAGLRADGPAQGFAPLRAREDKTHQVRFRYRREAQELRIDLNGDEIHRGTWTGGQARIVLLTQQTAADGRTLLRNLRLRSGVGLNQD